MSQAKAIVVFTASPEKLALSLIFLPLLSWPFADSLPARIGSGLGTHLNNALAG